MTHFSFFLNLTVSSCKTRFISNAKIELRKKEWFLWMVEKRRSMISNKLYNDLTATDINERFSARSD